MRVGVVSDGGSRERGKVVELGKKIEEKNRRE